MFASELLGRLAEEGYKLKAQGSELHLEYCREGKPDPAVVAPLLSEAKRQKANLIKALRYEVLPPPEAEELSALRLSQIEGEGRRIRMFSKVLDEAVWIVSSHAKTSDLPPEELCYTVPECAILIDRVPTPEQLRALHATKRHFDGRIS